ncbi:hypothetical protein, partial [Galactobacter sp.]
LNALMLATAQAEGMDEPATAADIRRWIVMLAHSVPQRYAGMLLQALRRHAAPEDVVTAALARFEAGQAWLDGCGLQATGIGTVVDVQIDIGMAAIRQILFTERGDTK